MTQRPDSLFPSREKMFALIEALEWYGNPGTYFAIAMIGDSPCGDFFDDFEKYPYPGDYSIQDKPGRKAREVIRALDDDPAGHELLREYIEMKRAELARDE